MDIDKIKYCFYILLISVSIACFVLGYITDDYYWFFANWVGSVVTLFLYKGALLAAIEE